MSDWPFLNRHRFNPGPPYPPTTAADGFCGAFSFPVPGEARRVCCIASNDLGWEHVSVSFGRFSKKTPSWELMCFVKDLFWEPGDWVIQFHPANDQYVSNHPGCLHLWKPVGKEFPVPESILVGFKEFGELKIKA